MKLWASQRWRAEVTDEEIVGEELCVLEVDSEGSLMMRLCSVLRSMCYRMVYACA